MAGIDIRDIDKYGTKAAEQIRAQMGVAAIPLPASKSGSARTDPTGAQTDVDKKPKYRNEPVEIDGYTFASKREGNRYRLLKAMQIAGSISGLEMQVPYRFFEGERLIFEYIADFRYTWIESGQKRVEDAKGIRTAVFMLKKRLIEARHGITIEEV
ncbi:hypothetical protein CCAX7_55070 [Capsulimonas corticalis]|uniref:Uncharacterized protein n=1 Tax=Capsulimonas corticalis TaxID=2219043 RepID=A0A402D5S5_9BACT|nr:DUF1064 domain-containing protein [Capsulimonas corticalis]BDI33456.1 hypothetical protein CCAX7_55070 [Capsulimonas corticalis]